MRLSYCAPGSWRIGSMNGLALEHSLVEIDGKPYLRRLIVYVLGRTFRLHKFYRGDDDRAFHDHPWPFWTFPLASYWERLPTTDGSSIAHLVQAFRVHERPSAYQHIVLGSASGRPFWTIVVTGRKERKWGFWPPGGRFVPWNEWK